MLHIYSVASAWALVLWMLSAVICGPSSLGAAEHPNGANASPNTEASAPRIASALASAAGAKNSSSQGYYIEFRVAQIGVYGHAYIAYGRLDGRGKPADVRYADLHPVGGNVGLAIGHLLPVAGDLQPEKEILALPLADVYRRKLNALEFRKLMLALNQTRAGKHVWSALANNCNDFAAEMARAIGLRTPSTLLFSYQFVPALRNLNETMKASAQPGATPDIKG